MRPLVVRRSPVKMVLTAAAGLPLLVVSLDVLTTRRITRWLQDRVFPNPEDLQIYEPRDVIFAWAMLLFSAFLVLWGLKEVFAPTRVVECRRQGLALRIAGPFRPAAVIAWRDVEDARAGEVVDEGAKVPLLIVEVRDRGALPDHPWGARWVEAGALGVPAEDWSRRPQLVAEKIVDRAAETARLEAPAEAGLMSAPMEEE